MSLSLFKSHYWLIPKLQQYYRAIIGKPYYVTATMLFALLFFITLRWQGSLFSILYTSPFFAFLLILILITLFSERQALQPPWSLLIVSIAFKFITWTTLSIIWFSNPPPNELLWPYTGSLFYLFELIGTFLIWIFCNHIIHEEIKRHYHLGLIADSSLFFIAAAIFLSITFNEITLEYFTTMTWKNAAVRIAILPSIYYVFVILIIIAIFHIHLKSQIIYLIAFVPFTIHLGIEAYANFYPINMEKQISYARFSVFFYDLAALLLLFYAKKVKVIPPPNETHHISHLSPFVWTASCLVLLATPLAIVTRYYFFNTSIPYDYAYFGASLAGLAVFIRLALLTNQARKQQHLLETEIMIDELTGSLNRHGFTQTLPLTILKQSQDTLFCLLDIDTFKAINDTYGHQIGDEVLRHITQQLTTHPQVILLGRLGGDEFVLLLQHTNPPQATLDELHHTLSSWQVFGNLRIFVSVSIGGIYTLANTDFSVLYTLADQALHQAKSDYSGAIFHASSNAKSNNTQQVLELIQSTLDQKKVLLHYHPIYHLSTGKMTSIEVLMRLQDRDGTVHPPSKFMAIAKKYNKIQSLTLLLLRVLKQDFAKLPIANIAINIPPMFFEKPQYFQQLMQAIEQIQYPPSRLLLEITEDGNANIPLLHETITTLYSKGYHFALDDFGSGSSSLSRLATLPVEIVKADISLLRAAERGSIAPLESVISIAHRLKAQVVVEGVENRKQLLIAQQLGADMVQGFYFSYPVTLNKLLTMPLEHPLLQYELST